MLSEGFNLGRFYCAFYCAFQVVCVGYCNGQLEMEDARRIVITLDKIRVGVVVGNLYGASASFRTRHDNIFSNKINL